MTGGPTGGPAAEREGDGGGAGPAPRPGPYPWRDLRLWAGAAVFAGLATVASSAWGAILPGRAAPTAGVALAAAVVALGNLAPALHPRARRWVAGGNVVPPVLPLVAAAALAPPSAGGAFWAFGFTVILLLVVWDRSAALVRSAVRLSLVLPEDGSAASGEMAPPPPGPPRAGRRGGFRLPVLRGRGPLDHLVGQAVLDPILMAAVLLALCDLGAGGRAAPAAARALGAAVACAAALALAAWAGRAQVLRRAEGEDAGVQHGFSRLWWWAAAPAVAACLLVGMLVPVYPAPLRGVGISGLVLAFVEIWTGRNGALAPHRGSAPGGGGGGQLAPLLIIGACVLVVLLAWPLRDPIERAVARAAGRAAAPPEERVTLRERLRLWWERLRERWRDMLAARRRPYRPQGRWRPLSGAAPRPRAGAADGAGAAPGLGDARGRVRSAYRRVLRDAEAAGLARQVSASPRRFLDWLVPRARPARFPLESLTARYEVARYSRHPVEAADAAGAEGDARAAAYGLSVALAERRRRAGEPIPDPTLRWTAPRGVHRRRG